MKLAQPGFKLHFVKEGDFFFTCTESELRKSVKNTNTEAANSEQPLQNLANYMKHDFWEWHQDISE